MPKDFPCECNIEWDKKTSCVYCIQTTDITRVAVYNLGDRYEIVDEFLNTENGIWEDSSSEVIEKKMIKSLYMIMTGKNKDSIRWTRR